MAQKISDFDLFIIYLTSNPTPTLTPTSTPTSTPTPT